MGSMKRIHPPTAGEEPPSKKGQEEVAPSAVDLFDQAISMLDDVVAPSSSPPVHDLAAVNPADISMGTEERGAGSSGEETGDESTAAMEGAIPEQGKNMAALAVDGEEEKPSPSIQSVQRSRALNEADEACRLRAQLLISNFRCVLGFGNFKNSV